MTNTNGDLISLYELKNCADLLKHLSEVHGEPIDSYWNGSHTWFTEPDGVLIEWRLHPVSGFVMPEASRPEELFVMAKSIHFIIGKASKFSLSTRTRLHQRRFQIIVKMFLEFFQTLQDMLIMKVSAMNMKELVEKFLLCHC